MSQSFTIGEFDAGLTESLRQFELVLHTEHLRLAWTHSDLCANFVSQYFATSFPAESEQHSTHASREEMTHSINYLINELMENVIKFHSGGQACLACGITGDIAGFLITNEISEQQVSPFANILTEITSSDPGLLLLQRIEQNAEDGSGGSGLGYLTLMNDYQARLGWHFEPVAAAPGQTKVTTMALLNLKKNS